MKKGISEKELSFISELEFKEKYFFTRNDIRDHFTSDNEMNVYIHRLKKKGRIIKLNKTKYYLVPVKAKSGGWIEHPLIVIDEMMNGEGYCIVGKAAAHYWKHIDQIPFEYKVYNYRRHEKVKIFNTRIQFSRVGKKEVPKGVVRNKWGHTFIIATKKESEKWS
jgi:predicted transcriptional regulator of viral defense system